MKSLGTWLVSAGVLVGFAAATPVYAQVSDTFVLMKKGKVVGTVTMTEAQEGTDGATRDFTKLFPLGTRFGDPDAPGDTASFVLTKDGKKLMVQVFSDGDSGGGTDPGESGSLLIVGKNGKPSPIADTLLIGSDKPVPAVP